MLFYILLFCDVQGQSDSTNITDFTKLLQGAFSESDNKDWQSANHQWQKITSINPTEGEFWYKLGESYYLDIFKKAIDVFDSSLHIGSPPLYEGAYFITKAYAALNDKA